MHNPLDRVRQVIEASGLSQGDFAAAIGLDASKMSKSLRGARRFTSLDYANIAEVGKVTIDWLLTGVEPPLALAARVASGTSAATAVARARRFAELRHSAVGLGFMREVVSLGQDGGGSWRAQGEVLAEAAWARCRTAGVDPLAQQLPEVIEQAFGIDVAVVDLGASFDGLAAHSADGALILVSPTPVFARQRFTMAHELGHLLAGDDQEVHADEDIDSPASRTGETEVRANAFAAAFLMPAAGLKTKVGRGFDEAAFAQLVLDFRVSPAALAIRLEGLNLIDSMAAARFKRLTYADAVAGANAGAGARAAEDVQQGLRIRPPGLLAQDLLDAYLAGKTTLRLYAQALGVDPEEIRAQFEDED